MARAFYEHKLFTIVEQFCEQSRDPAQREQLLKAVRGKSALRDFNSLVHELHLRDQWIGFRNAALGRIATAWLDEHGITFNKAA